MQQHAILFDVRFLSWIQPNILTDARISAYGMQFSHFSLPVAPSVAPQNPEEDP